MNKQALERFKEMFGGQKWVYANENTITDFLSKELDLARKEERENIINVIKKELFDTEKTLEQSAVQRDEKLVRIYKSHITAYLKIINLINKEEV